jgi:hypothetical protein
MRKVTRKPLALLCVVLVAFATGGCATMQETVQEHPKTVIGAAAGTAGGALLGGLVFKSAAGAVVGGLVGGLAGGLIGNAMETQQKDRVATEREYNYHSAQGTVVRIQEVEVTPSRIRRGEQVDLIVHYALLTPNANRRVMVTERWDISRGGHRAGNPMHTVQRQGGTWTSIIPVTLATNAQSGTYNVAVTIEADNSRDSATASFAVR